MPSLEGQQWKNTYFLSDPDEVTGTAFNGRAKGSEIRGEEDIPDGAQGLLFHPETGTGRPGDPLVGPERRDAAVRGVYGPASEHTPSETVDTMVGAVAASNVPTHDFEDPEGQFLSRQRGMGMIGLTEIAGGPFTAGSYNSENDRIGAGRRYLDSPTTLLHETGHALHMAGDRSDAMARNPDPLMEGVADGFSEGWTPGGYSDLEGEQLRPTAVRTSPNERGEKVDPTDRHLRIHGDVNTYDPSYSSAYGEWMTPVDRALYSAARQHAAVTGETLPHDYRSDIFSGAHAPSALATYGSAVQYPQLRSERDTRNLLGLGRLVYESPHALKLFQQVDPDKHSKHWADQREAAAIGLGMYKSMLDKSAVDPEEVYAAPPVGVDQGWKASDTAVRANDELRQGWTLPLDDPETGQQYDNRQHTGDPVFPAGNPLPKSGRTWA